MFQVKTKFSLQYLSHRRATLIEFIKLYDFFLTIILKQREEVADNLRKAKDYVHGKR